MPVYEVAAPNGKTYHIEGPAGASLEQVQAQIMRLDPSAGQARKTIADRAAPEGRLGTAARSFTNAATAGWADNAVAALNAVVPLDRLTGKKEDTGWGKESFAAAYRKNLAREQATTTASATAHPGVNLAGEIAGVVASPLNKLAAPFKGANALSRLARIAVPAAAYGAAEGAHGGNALQRLKGAGTGAAESVAGAAAGSVVGRFGRKIIAPKFSKAVQSLIDKGVRLTPGQMAGGGAKTTEDKAVSIPGLGGLIKNARHQSLQDWNRAIYNRVLEPLGIQYQGNEVGHQGVDQVEKTLNSQYEKILPKLQFKPGATFIKAVQSLMNEAGELPADQKRQLETIIVNRVAPRFGANGVMDGKTFNLLDSELGNFSRKYKGSSDAGQREMAQIIGRLQGAMRYDLERSNPVFAPTLKRLNQSWASFARLRDAASRRLDSTGVITPTDLLAAVKKGDRTVGKGAFARGEAMMQKEAKEAHQVLPSTVPNSGTVDRAAAGIGLAEGLLHGPAVAAGVAAHPIGTAAALGAAGLYTRPGMNALRALMTKGSPKTRNALAKLIEKSATRAGMLAGPAAAQQLAGPTP